MNHEATVSLVSHESGGKRQYAVTWSMSPNPDSAVIVSPEFRRH